MSSDWTSENGQHFHKCTVDGCTYTDTKVTCSGGTPTCQAKAVCSTCHQAYGEIGNHSFDMSDWGYTGTDGHAHVCTVSGCDEHDTVVEHTPNVDAATEDVAKYCTVCDFVIEQKLNHVHAEGTEWKYNSEYHWHDCVGNDGQEYSKAKHTYDNDCDTTCNVRQTAEQDTLAARTTARLRQNVQPVDRPTATLVITHTIRRYG